ncbi:MAG TPA: ATP synthase F1 subunit delta [Candidatus Limnocylindria bacterium]
MALTGSGARRYAQAMLDIATPGAQVDAFRDSLGRLSAGLGADSLRALRDPSVPLVRRMDALRAVTEGEPAAIRSLLLLLAERDRLALLPGIATALAELVDRRAGIAKAKITTAIGLDERQQAAFVEQLERASGKKLRASFAVDPGLIGGAKVQVGDHLVDTSVRAKLDALRIQLAS